jgi:AbrB family looped-hinge helix DNA binding protein
MIVEISKGYQITIPASIRNELDIGIGSALDISKMKEKIIIQPIKTDLKKMFEISDKKKPRHKLSVEDMEKYNEAMFR